MLRTLHLLAAFLTVTFGCTCLPHSPDGKQEFCNADVVGVFKILKKFQKPNSFRINYYVSASQIFKTNAGNNAIQLIETASQSAACGLTWLQEGQEYLLNGSYDPARNIVRISICGQIAPTQWSNVPADIKNALENGGYEPCPAQKLN
ncbi:hypothetical protein QR680_004118 [Steinernema hermaphroditum]|uniref:NTR domain-containing protein n=1 Tax=Steinernema hermaphroditum TaxID=289476 RepID=A0AA39LTG4_9BILA|nr:hypothetical protein QR680_004118 [Steinernema hermaphroditum]